MRKLLLALFMAAALCALPRPASAQPIQMGDAMVTCSDYNITNLGAPVLARVSLQGANTAPLNVNWPTTMFHDPLWTMQNLGSIFGIALDPSGNAYITATSCYNSAYYPSGSGAIFKIDGATNAYSVFATLPNDATIHPALGNICYDPDHNQFFATDLEDGMIYRISITGTVLPAYDPFAADGGSAGFAPRGERLWGIGYYNHRVYFGRWNEDAGTPNAAVYNEIWSVAVNGAGVIVPGPTLEIRIPHLAGQIYSNPPSDIEFSSAGNMLIAERGWSNDVSGHVVPHEARVLEYHIVGVSWVPTAATFSIGQIITQQNGSGGTDYGYKGFDKKKNQTINCDSMVWTTADAIHFNYPSDVIYGLQGFPATGGSIANSVLIDMDGDLTSQQKTWIGDIDVYKNCAVSSPCDKVGAKMTFDNTMKGKCCWDVTITNNAAVTWTGVRLDILTPGVHFASNTAPAAWTVTPTPTSAFYTPNAGSIPNGNSGPLKFCLTAVTNPPPAAPQKLTLTWVGKNGEICVDTLFTDCQLPPPSCAEFTNLSFACKTVLPAVPSYTMTFKLHNISGFNIDFAQMVVTSPGMGVTISPSLITFATVPNGGTSTQQTVTLTGAAPGTVVCITVRVCDRQKLNCCTFDTCFRVPKCADCCDSLHGYIHTPKLGYNPDGSINFGTTVTTVPSQIRKFEATIVSATQASWCKGKVTPQAPVAATFTSGTFTTAPVLPLPTTWGTPDITWGTNYTGVTVTNASLTLKIKLPPLPAYKCYDTIRMCIKFTYTDTACRTCDTTICFTQIRTGSIFFPGDQADPTKLPFGPGQGIGDGGSGKTKGNDRSTLAGGDADTKAVTITMSSESDGTLTIVNPSADQGGDPNAPISIVGLLLEPAVGTDLTSMTDDATGQSASIVDRVGSLEQLSRSIDQGEARTFTLSYDNTVRALTFENYVRVRYTLGDDREDVYEATMVVYARTPSGSGGDQLSVDDGISLTNVRTYGLKFDNGNPTGDRIARVVVTVDRGDGDDIIAVGPGIDHMKVGLKAFRTTEADARNLLLAEEPNEDDAVVQAVDPKAEITPIYVTVCGGADKSASFGFTTYNEAGEVVSSGTFSADNPLAPGKAGIDNPSSTSMVLNALDCIPNPLTNTAMFSFTLQKVEPKVTLTITDVNGNEVARVIDGRQMEAGRQDVTFDASKLPSGTYFYTLRTSNATQTRRMEIIR